FRSYVHLDAYMSPPPVAAGDEVAAGQKIGTVGLTKIVTSAHLHWSVYRAGELIDPMSLIAHEYCQRTSVLLTSRGRDDRLGRLTHHCISDGKGSCRERLRAARPNRLGGRHLGRRRH